MRRNLLLLTASLTLLVPMSASAFVTPFGVRVTESINRGLDFIRGLQDGNGGWGSATGFDAGNATFLPTAKQIRVAAT